MVNVGLTYSMRISELLPRFRVCRLTVIRWIKSGRLKAKMVKPQWGGHDYYDISEEDLQEYLSSLERE